MGFCCFFMFLMIFKVCYLLLTADKKSKTSENEDEVSIYNLHVNIILSNTDKPHNFLLLWISVGMRGQLLCWAAGWHASVQLWLL